MAKFFSAPLRASVLCVGAAVSAAFIAASIPTPVLAQAGMSCADGVKGLTERRKDAIAGLNVLAKSGKGKLDPQLACPKLKGLVAVEAALSAYLVKNKDWCQIPDDVISNLAASRVKTEKFAQQACSVAAKVVQMKKEAASQAAQQAAQEAARLPAGPL